MSSGLRATFNLFVHATPAHVACLPVQGSGLCVVSRRDRLEPLERVWRFLRSEKLHDAYYATFPAIRETILSFCTKNATPNEDLIRLCANA